MNTRRTFLKAAGAAAISSPISSAADRYSTPPGWFDKPMRWAQLVFVEDDPGRFDLQFWLDYFRRTHSDAACLAGGGYMAFYPTRIPLHYRSRFLGSGDPFGDLVNGCRKLGMHVIARTDPHAAHQDLYDAHPDWIAVDANGNKRRHWANPELWVTCALGPMNFEFMTEVTKEIVRMYGVDGVFSNRWAGHGQCFCEHCRRNFEQFSGYDLPRSNDPHDPARRAYIVWHEQRLFEVWRLWDSEIRKINPNARFIANSGGGALSELDMKTVGELSDILFADRQVDQTTGAILLTAQFPNPGNVLRPGEYAKVRAIIASQHDALLIPQRAVTELQGNYLVAVVNAENKVEIANVKVGDRVGALWLINEGLTAGQRVIADGSMKVRSGMQVNPKPRTAAIPGEK